MNNIPSIIVSGIGVSSTTIPLLLTEGFFVATAPQTPPPGCLLPLLGMG